EAFTDVMGRYFDEMKTALERHGGTVEKFIGDAVMAAFGVPLVREDDAERALRAALDMLARLEDLNKTFQDRHDVTLAVRIGVNTGEVIAPVGGPTEQMIVTGDAVNVAARLEQAAEPGTVMVGERTHTATRNAFRFGQPVSLDLKGKAEPVPAYPLEDVLPEAIRGVPGLTTAMVGRDQELQTLSTLLDRAATDRSPRLAVVYGPAGIGKSRLIREFVRAARGAHPDAPVLTGRCLAAGQGVTYWALGEILRAACGISLDEPVDSAAEKLRTTARTLLERVDGAPEDVQHTVFALATTAGIPLPDNPLDRIEPRAVADELGRAWPRLATALTARTPAVFVVEDLHWAEPPLLDMLERLLVRTDGPLVVLATARPEFAQDHPGFGAGGEGLTTLSLRPLTDEQSAELVEGLLALADLPDALRTEILSRAEGNPFFLEEIIRRLIDEGVLVRTERGWQATEVDHAGVLPDTIHSLLAARIDALPAEEKQVLQEASVVGRTFWAEPVSRSLDRPAHDGVDVALLGLERRGLIQVRPTSTIAGQVEYAFKHALVRDVAYASLPRARRARSHATLGGWIEVLAADRREEFAELLAHHFAMAASGEDADLAWEDDPSAREAVRAKAFDALLAAGAAVRKRYALDKAVSLHQRALDLAASDADRARAHEALALDHIAGFRGDEAMEASRQALEIFRRDPAVAGDRARVCARMAAMAAEKSGAFRAQPSGREIDELVEEGLGAVPDPESRAWLLAAKGHAGVYRESIEGHDPVPLDDRISAAEEAVALAREIGNAEVETFAGRGLAAMYETGGRWRASMDAARDQLGLLDRIESRSEQAAVLFQAGVALAEIGSLYEEALELGRRTLELARDLSTHELMHATYLVLLCLYHLGRWSEITDVLEEHLAAMPGEKDVACFAVQSGPLLGALALAHMGESARSRELAATPPPDVGELRARRYEGTRARALVAVGDVARGRALAEEAFESLYARWPPRAVDAGVAVIEALVAQEDWAALALFLPRVDELAGASPELRLAMVRAEGLVSAAEGRREEAAAKLREALEAFEGLNDRFEVARTQEALAGVVEDADERALLLASAHETYEALGAAPHQRRVSSLLDRA
ncbi:MAG TPA: AAA family ATPase, partial [Actinomycetota bacterium]|nr:AAA family ATPase [Actinomycetota bacterium]